MMIAIIMVGMPIYIIELVWPSGWTLPLCSIFFTIFILDDFHMAKRQSFLGNGCVPHGCVPRKLFFLGTNVLNCPSRLCFLKKCNHVPKEMFLFLEK